MDSVILTPLKQIHSPKGDIYHAMKKSSNGYDGFGEAYFSMIDYAQVRAWKKHKKMISNIIVPEGKVRFVFADENFKKFKKIIIGRDNYIRLTVPPKIWFGFQGLSKKNNLILNISSIKHDPKEQISENIDNVNFSWKI